MKNVIVFSLALACSAFTPCVESSNSANSEGRTLVVWAKCLPAADESGFNRSLRRKCEQSIDEFQEIIEANASYRNSPERLKRILAYFKIRNIQDEYGRRKKVYSSPDDCMEDLHRLSIASKNNPFFQAGYSLTDNEGRVLAEATNCHSEDIDEEGILNSRTVKVFVDLSPKYSPLLMDGSRKLQKSIEAEKNSLDPEKNFRHTLNVIMREHTAESIAVMKLKYGRFCSFDQISKTTIR